MIGFAITYLFGLAFVLNYGLYRFMVKYRHNSKIIDSIGLLRAYLGVLFFSSWFIESGGAL